MAPPPRPSDSLKITLRWTAEDETVLIWETRPQTLPLDAGGYWTPLLVEMPLWPGGAGFLRFDVIGEAAFGKYPVAIGFVFADAAGAPATALAGEVSAFDVLAVSPWTSTEAAAASWPAADLASLPCLPVDATTYAPAPAMMLLDITGWNDGEILLIVDWPGFGTPLAYAGIGYAGIGYAGIGASTGSHPCHIAVPRRGPDHTASRLILRAARDST